MQKNVVDIIKEIVQATADKLGIEILYDHGHPLEIIQNVKRMTSTMTESKKYPAIYLFQDFPEKDVNDLHFEVSLHLAIVTLTDNNLMASERYLATFNTSLIPIYNEFRKQLIVNINIDARLLTDTPCTKWDRLYWGRNPMFGYEYTDDKGISKIDKFADYIDAIEIEDMKLKIKINNNCN